MFWLVDKRRERLDFFFFFIFFYFFFIFFYLFFFFHFLSKILSLTHPPPSLFQVAETNLNQESSRSHCIFTIKIKIKELNEQTGEEVIKVGKLNLVDLAGSENVERSGATKRRATEAGNINKSLLALAKVIKDLASQSGGYISYRESKLTRLLQESLGLYFFSFSFSFLFLFFSFFFFSSYLPIKTSNLTPLSLIRWKGQNLYDRHYLPLR